MCRPWRPISKRFFNIWCFQLCIYHLHQQHEPVLLEEARNHKNWCRVQNSPSWTCLHNKWLTIDVIIDYINVKYQLRDEINIGKASLIHLHNKYYTDKTTTGNVLVLVTLEDGSIVQLYRQAFQVAGTRQHFVYITLKAKAPIFPTAAYASSWEAECASKVLPRMTRQQVKKNDVLPLPAKRQRTKWYQTTTKQTRRPDARKLSSMSSVASLDATSSLLNRGGGMEPLDQYSKMVLHNVPQQTTWTLRWLSKTTCIDLMEVE